MWIRLIFISIAIVVRMQQKTHRSLLTRLNVNVEEYNKRFVEKRHYNETCTTNSDCYRELLCCDFIRVKRCCPDETIIMK